MDSIKDIIHDVIGQMAKAQGHQGGDINGIWQRISGGKGSSAVALKNGALTVHVDSAMRMVKLNLRREQSLDGMKKEFPAVERIYFKVGKL